MTTIPETPDRFYSTASVAELFDVKVETVQTWIKEGKLPAVKIGSRWKIRHSAVMALANERHGPTT